MVNFVFTITQTSMPLWAAQIAFKDLMIHRHVQFTLRIAFRCVLHRPASQDIHCQKLCLILMFIKEERAKENAAHKGTLFKLVFLLL
jgi:hypothetical protein